MSILFGVPQRFVLVPLLFVIYIWNLFILNDHLELETIHKILLLYFMGKILTKYLVKNNG